MFLSIIPFLKKLIVSFHRANLIYRYLRNDYNSFRNSFLKLNISRVSIGKVDKLRNKGSMKFNLKTNIFNRKIHFKYHKNHSMSLFINIKKFLKSTKKNILTKKKSKKSFKEHNYNSHEKFVSMRRLFYSKSIQLFTPYRKFKLKYLHLDLFRKYSSTVVSSYPEKLKFPRSLFLEKKKLKNSAIYYLMKASGFENHSEEIDHDDMILNDILKKGINASKEDNWELAKAFKARLFFSTKQVINSLEKPISEKFFGEDSPETRNLRIKKLLYKIYLEKEPLDKEKI